METFVRIVYLLVAFGSVFGHVAAISDPDEAYGSPSCIYKKIPQFLSVQCTILTIQNTNLGDLNAFTFRHLQVNASNIRTLILSNNGITGIAINAMQPFPVLENLDLSDNSITQIGSQIFLTQDRITNLYLQRNKISSLSNRSFDGLESLKVLRLDDNELTSIDSSFSTLDTLESLNLTANNIAVISPDAFDGINKLYSLFLAYNSLTEMPEALQASRLKQKLHILNLRSNLINTRLNSSHLHYDYLEELYLTNNDIPSLSDDVFQYLRRLEVLHLDYNRLMHFDSWSKQHPQNIHEIKLDNNLWDCECNNIEVWDLLRNQENLTILERDSTSCVTPTSRRDVVAFDFPASCESDPLLSSAEQKGIISAIAIFLTGCLMVVCICCFRRNCKRRVMAINPAQSPRSPSMTTTNSQVELPNHEYLSHPAIPTNVKPGQHDTNINLVVGDCSTLRSHIYDSPDFQEALRRDPSYINNKVLRMNLQKSGINLKPLPHGKRVDSDTDDTDYYLVPIDILKKDRLRNDSDDGIVV